MEKFIWLMTEGWEDDKLRPLIRIFLIVAGFAFMAATDTFARALF